MKWKTHSRLCPYCRTEYTLNTAPINIFANLPPTGYLFNKFNNWINENNIPITTYIQTGYHYIIEIDKIWQLRTSEFQQSYIDLQIVNPNRIHKIRYNTLNDVSFEYNIEYKRILIKGGTYYLDNVECNSLVGWWLHSLVGEYL